nr:RecName: Full=Pregnancy-associated glycoprotein 62A; Short=FdPAG62A [Dama dama]
YQKSSPGSNITT